MSYLDPSQESAMRTVRRLTLGLVLGTLGLTGGCSDSSGPGDGTKPPSELNVVQLRPESPPLFNAEGSFYARKGEDRELRIFFQDEAGGSGEEFLRLRVDAPSLLARPDGTPFLPGDSILITVRVVDPSRILFEMEPAGLTFSPLVPAELKIHYQEANDDLNEDGRIDGEDDQLRGQLAIWRQESLGGVFERLTSINSEELEEIEASIPGFSRYAIAY
jgi:hypothetical protein